MKKVVKKIINKSLIEKKVKELNCVLSSYDEGIEILTKKALDKVIDNLDQEYTDIFVTIRNKVYIVEIATMDLKEKDLTLYSDIEYFSKYGDEEKLDNALDDGDITQEQYSKIYNELF